MRTKVTEQGVTLPKHWFPGVAEVEIQREDDRVVVVPVRPDDPITRLGLNPVNIDVDDAAANHDRDDVTERLNRVYGENPSNLDPALAEMQRLSLTDDAW
jgi:virulence-associated protein VagC